MTEVSIACDARAMLGECPLWSLSRDQLLWVDTLASTLDLFDPASGGSSYVGSDRLHRRRSCR